MENLAIEDPSWDVSTRSFPIAAKVGNMMSGEISKENK